MASFQSPAQNTPCNHVLPQPGCVQCHIQNDRPQEVTVITDNPTRILTGADWLIVGLAQRDMLAATEKADRTDFLWLERLDRIGYECVQHAVYAQDQLLDVVEEYREWQFNPSKLHYDNPCTGNAELCDGPCYDLCDCVHCAGGWVLGGDPDYCPCGDNYCTEHSTPSDNNPF